MKRIAFALLLCTLAACTRSSQTTTATDVTAASETAAMETTATDTAASSTTATTTAAATTASEEKPMSSNAYENKVAVLHTTAGEIHIRFFPDVAPNHVKNFLDLAQNGFYNGIKFHRVIPGFMIQAGDPNTISGDPRTWGTGGSPNKLRAEFNTVSHKRGIVSAARTNDPNSASSQFFVVTSDSTFLDRQYTVFGQVVKGMDVADKIVNAPKGAGDRPNDPVSITKITIRDAAAGETGPAPTQ